MSAGTMTLPASRSGNAKALLAEMLRMLERLLAAGEGGSIDLRAVPLTKGDLDHLRSVLGGGEVDARITALGESRASETSFPGIWWVTHENEAGEVVAESIEVCAVPEILLAAPADIAEGAKRLRRTLTAAAEGKE